MYVETKFLRLFRAAELGDDVDGWRVCWLSGWDKCRVLFVVMVERGPGPVVINDTLAGWVLHKQRVSLVRVLPPSR
jgi:hypothetical protein